MSSIPTPVPSLQEILFDELHHRFYNSLQLVSSAIGVLASDPNHSEEIAVLRDRIATLGGLHRALARPLIDLDDMHIAFGELCTSLTHGFARGKVTLCLAGMTFPQDPMTVRGLTLILVELVTNALKHSAADTVLIKVEVACSDSSYRMTVANVATFRTAAAERPPVVASRFAKAMGGTLKVSAGAEHSVCVTVPISVPPFITEEASS